MKDTLKELIGEEEAELIKQAIKKGNAFSPTGASCFFTMPGSLEDVMLVSLKGETNEHRGVMVMTTRTPTDAYLETSETELLA